MLAILIVLNIIDFLETYFGIAYHRIVEANKLIHLSMDYFGVFWGLFLPKLLVVILASVGFFVPWERVVGNWKTLVIWMLVLDIVVYVVVVVQNMYQILR